MLNSSQKLIDFLNESKVKSKPSKARSMFFSKRHKSKKKQKYQPIIVEPTIPRLDSSELQQENNSVLTLLKREYNNAKRPGSKNNSVMSQDSFISLSTEDSFESSVVSNMRLPTFNEIRSSTEDSHLDLLDHNDQDIETALGMVLDEGFDYSDEGQLNFSQSSLELPIVERPSLISKKSVQFSGVDVISHSVSKSANLKGKSAFKEKLSMFESIISTESEDDYDSSASGNVQVEWATSRTTQTEFMLNENDDNLSNEELRQRLREMKEENEEMKSGLHTLIDENSYHVKQHNSIKLNLEEVQLQQEQVMEEYAGLKTEFDGLNSLLSETRKQLQQSNKKTRELEKLSKKAISRIKELDGEKKFLNMQVDWLRGKMLQANLDEQEDEEEDEEQNEYQSSSYNSSSSSYKYLQSQQKNSKWNSKKRQKSTDEGWETDA